MPNAHSPEKESLSLFIPRSLATKLRKHAAARGQTLTAYILDLFHHATRDTVLSPEENQIVADATCRAQEKRRRLATPHPSGSRACR